MITSSTNPVVKAARRLRRRHDRQRAGGTFLVEGARALREAAPHLRRLFVTPAAMDGHGEFVAAVEARGGAVVAVSEAVLATIVDTVTPQGMVGVATLPHGVLETVLTRADAVDAPGAGAVVVCDQVRDPGNLGAIVRTADAAGAAGIVLTGDSVDIRNAKVVRASAGSVFHLPIVEQAAFEDVAEGCRGRGITLVGASAEGSVEHSDVDFTRPTGLVFGNEAHGLEQAVLAACDAVARVPLYGAAESLNLAASAAVMLYEAARQRAVAQGRTA